MQWGNSTDMSENPRLVPRTYVSHRYYSSNDFTVEAELQLEDLSAEFPPLASDAQRFGEISFRIKDLQVSIYAIPEAGMRLMWRYYTPDGVEVADNSARDLSNLVEDEMQVPLGRFKVKLRLQKNKAGATDVEASVNGQRFAHKVLLGLAGQVGKVAVGCRNLSCRFDDLIVTGKPAARPAPRKTEQ
ncbi:MAG: Serine/threonine protein kinase [Myxococcaceae bacterium]|nr:Serine/threonine protein kinase [Myxococcaceae bacterium]